MKSITSGSITLKVLTTNEVSVTLQDKENLKGTVIQPKAAANRAHAEHGLAMSIEVSDGEDSHLYLLDTGGMGNTIVHNAKQFGVDLGDVEKIILSHGHFDHFGGLTDVLPEVKENCEFYLSPNCYSQNYVALTKTGEEVPPEELPTAIRKSKERFKINNKLPPFSKRLLTKLGDPKDIKIIETDEPMELHEGIMTSGQIELFDPSEVTAGFYIMKGRKEFKKHTFRDETSLYFNVEGKGLVVITGCGHCGIVNTIKHGQQLTGMDKVHAVIGGFHEEWNPVEVIEKKVDFLENLDPDIICGMHCTGFPFNKMMSEHPAHALGVVGTEFRF